MTICRVDGNGNFRHFPQIARRTSSGWKNDCVVRRWNGQKWVEVNWNQLPVTMEFFTGPQDTLMVVYFKFTIQFLREGLDYPENFRHHYRKIRIERISAGGIPQEPVLVEGDPQYGFFSSGDTHYTSNHIKLPGTHFWYTWHTLFISLEDAYGYITPSLTLDLSKVYMRGDEVYKVPGVLFEERAQGLLYPDR